LTGARFCASKIGTRYKLIKGDGVTLSTQRRFVTPRTEETLEALAARALPDRPLDAAMDEIRSYNMHVFVMRRPAGLLLGSDVVFVEPPLQ
jgi:hypothetical protein